MTATLSFVWWRREQRQRRQEETVAVWGVISARGPYRRRVSELPLCWIDLLVAYVVFTLFSVCSVENKWTILFYNSTSAISVCCVCAHMSENVLNQHPHLHRPGPNPCLQCFHLGCLVFFVAPKWRDMESGRAGQWLHEHSYLKALGVRLSPVSLVFWAFGVAQAHTVTK